jgi:hypothetical protein
MPEAGGVAERELKALSFAPSRKACSFRSMTSYGSHYRTDASEAGSLHATYDAGVAELQARTTGAEYAGEGGAVDLVRVGILKDIVVLNYVTINVVLMCVSWVAKHSEVQPRLRRDPHGFWLANLAAVPRETADPYILPSLASQVPAIVAHIVLLSSALCDGWALCTLLTLGTCVCRCFLWTIRQCQDGVLS